MKSTKKDRTIGILGVLFMTFGITYFNFEHVVHEENIKPAIMIGLGIITIGYFFLSKRNDDK